MRLSGQGLSTKGARPLPILRCSIRAPSRAGRSEGEDGSALNARSSSNTGRGEGSHFARGARKTRSSAGENSGSCHSRRECRTCTCSVSGSVTKDFAKGPEETRARRSGGSASSLHKGATPAGSSGNYARSMEASACAGAREVLWWQIMSFRSRKAARMTLRTFSLYVRYATESKGCIPRIIERRPLGPDKGPGGGQFDAEGDAFYRQSAAQR